MKSKMPTWVDFIIASILGAGIMWTMANIISKALEY